MNLPAILRRRLSIALLGAALLSVAACGADPTPTPTPAPTATPTPELTWEDLASSAGGKLTAMTSAKFSMIDENESGALFFNMEFKGMEAEIGSSPDSVRMLVNAVAPLGFVTIEMIAVGQEAYMKFSADAPWAPLPIDQVPFNFYGLGDTMGALVSNIDNGAIARRETVDGAQTIRVDGDLRSDDLSGLITSSSLGHSLTVVLWLNESDHTLRQLRITGRIFDDDAPETQRLIGLGDYNVPVDIQLPDTAAGS
ncbi:MAG: LppX_LprAFG lipoprotein [Dehalococcoidia bacterium]|nr:LppX_LprAFG lipoprotein [Dehalococcoidia bacterium]